MSDYNWNNIDKYRKRKGKLHHFMKNLLKHGHMYQAVPFLNYIIENLIWFLSDFLVRCTCITWYLAFLKKCVVWPLLSEMVSFFSYCSLNEDLWISCCLIRSGELCMTIDSCCIIVMCYHEWAQCKMTRRFCLCLLLHLFSLEEGAVLLVFSVLTGINNVHVTLYIRFGYHNSLNISCP